MVEETYKRYVKANYDDLKFGVWKFGRTTKYAYEIANSIKSLVQTRKDGLVSEESAIVDRIAECPSMIGCLSAGSSSKSIKARRLTTSDKNQPPKKELETTKAANKQRLLIHLGDSNSTHMKCNGLHPRTITLHHVSCGGGCGLELDLGKLYYMFEKSRSMYCISFGKT